VRVSFVGTRTGDRFHSDTDQADDLEREAARLGGQLVLLPPELNVSGGLALEKRPSLLAAVEGVEAGEYAGIIVSYLSRLGRSIREQLRAWDRVEAAGGRIVVVREGIDTSTATGRMYRNILLVMAEAEREQHAERFEERRRLATEAGIWQRRQTPLGYRRDPATRHLVPDEHAHAVVGLFGARAAGTPLVQLADRVKMTPSGVRALLRNRVYLGELRVGEHVNFDAHPAIVTPDEFDAAQVTVPRPPRGIRADGPALLAGLVRCAGCGRVMSRARTARVVYVCHGRHSGGRCAAPAAITAALLDAHVEQIARRELGRLRVQSAESGGHVDAARTELTAAERELAAYLQAVEAAGLAPGEFAAGAKQRRERIDVARDRLQRQLRVRAVAPVYDGGVEAWDRLDVHERRTLLGGLLGGVIVRRAGGRGARARLEDRVRVLDADVTRPAPGVFPDADDPHTLRVPGRQDAFEGAGG